MSILNRESCVKCPDVEIPGYNNDCDCKEGEVCYLQTYTCDQCPKLVCKPGPDGSQSSEKSATGKRTGLTVGLVLTFVVLLAIALVAVYYFKYWKKRNHRLDTSNSSSLHDEKELQEVLPSRNRNAVRAASIRGIYHAGNRSSAATVVTRASNVLPVAYIPGVTAVNKKFRGRRMFNNNGDTRSHITLGSSIFDGDDDEDDIEIPPISRERDSTVAQHANNLTTAIRARPKLVQISEEEEAEERYKYLSSGQRLSREDVHDEDDSLKAFSNASDVHSGEYKQAPLVDKRVASLHTVTTNTQQINATLDDSDNSKPPQINLSQSGSILNEETKEKLPYATEKADKINQDLDGGDDDDEGSFILAVEVEGPRRLNTT